MSYIKIKKIPKSEGNIVARNILFAATEYFEDPRHQREFEEWKKNRDSKKSIIAS